MIRHVLPHNVVAQYMLSGDLLDADDLKAKLAEDPRVGHVMSRFSTYIYDLRKYEGALIRTVKEGRKVVAYQLKNAKSFNQYGMLARSNGGRTRDGKIRGAARKGVLPKGDVLPKMCGPRAEQPVV